MPRLLVDIAKRQLKSGSGYIPAAAFRISARPQTPMMGLMTKRDNGGKFGGKGGDYSASPEQQPEEAVQGQIDGGSIMP